jgi:hypothetical protein
VRFEELVAVRLEGDGTLTAILTGGVYTRAEVGRDGITRESAPAAFDADGFLKPAALVRQRGLVPDGVVRDQIERVASAAQVVEIWLYEDRGYASIDGALEELFGLLEGYQFESGFPAEWINTIDREQDEGALAGASLARMDFLINVVKE